MLFTVCLIIIEQSWELISNTQIFSARFLLNLIILLAKTKTMIILQEEDNDKGAFYIEERGNRLAEMDYHIDKGRMVIDHTEVDESLRGRNIGFSLVERGVEYATEKHYRIIPFCTYAKKVIESTDRFKAILQEQQ